MVSANVMFAQTYDMKITEGSSSVYAPTNSINSINFRNTSAFVCGDIILYGGDIYPTILIGSQCWFQKNLNIGTRIDSSSNQSDNSVIEKYCYKDIDASCTTFGGLYQWAEALQYLNGATNSSSLSTAFTGNVQGICPLGWHIPTYDEFTTLLTPLGGNGKSLKTIGVGSNEYVGTNATGFSALLVGSLYYYTSANFLNLNVSTYFWSSTETFPAKANGLSIYSAGDSGDIGGIQGDKLSGFSIRCLKD